MKYPLSMSAALLSLLALGGCNRAESPEVAHNDNTITESPESPQTQAPADTDRTMGETVADATLTGKVKTALTADPATKARQIDVTTYSGTVELNGFVDSSDEKQRAEEVTRSVSGVKEVRNELEVKQDQSP